LLDLDLNGGTGLDLLTTVSDASERTRVIVLTGATSHRLHTDALRLGARGFLTKQDAAQALIKAIHQVHRGDIWFDRETVREVFDGIVNRTNRSRQDPDARKIGCLSKRELEVIRLIGEGLDNDEISSRLFISEKTVRNHLTSIFSKLEVRRRLELVVYAY